MPPKLMTISTKVFALFFAAFATLILFSPKTYAVVRTWDGGGAGDINWLQCTNWSGDVCPGGGDVATFDGTNTGNVTVNGTFTVGGIDINSGYTGTITMASGITLTVAGSNFDIASGTFSGVADATLDSDADVIISGGAFNAPGTMRVGDDWTHVAGGTFAHNNSTLTFDTNQDALLDGSGAIASSMLFYNVKIEKTTNWLVQINSADTMTVEGNLTLNDGRFIPVSTATSKADVKGNLIVASTIDGATTNVRFIGSGIQDIDLTGATALFDGDIIIEGSGTVRPITALTMNAPGQDLTVKSGTFDPNGQTILFEGDFLISGGTFASSGSFETNGIFTISGGTFNAPSTLIVADDWVHTAGGVFNHTNGTVTFDAAEDTLVDGSGGIASSALFYNLTVQKSTGWEWRVNTGDTVYVVNTATLADGRTNGTDVNASLEVRGDVVVGSGLDTGTLHMKFKSNANQNFDLSGAAALYDGAITIDKTGGTVTLLSDLTMDTSSRAFTMTNGTFTSTSRKVRTYDYNQTGGTFNGGTLLDIDNSYTQSGGTFNAPTDMTVTNDWTHTTGGTFNHQNGTVMIELTADSRIDIDSTATAGVFYNFRMFKTSGWLLDIATGDTVVVEGELRLSDGRLSQVTLNNGSLDVKGNVVIESGVDLTTNVFLRFTGSADQTLTGSGSGADAVFDGDITVAKSSGSVRLLTALTLNAANQDLIVNTGTFDIDGQNLTVNGSTGKFSVNSGGTFRLQGGETITLNASNPTLDFGSTVLYDGGSVYTIKDYTYSNLSFDNAAGSFNLPSTKTIKNLTITNGTFSLAGQNFTATGTVSNNGFFELQGAETLSMTNDIDSGTVTYVGNGNGLANPFVTKDLTYYNLRIGFMDSGDNASHADGTLDVNGTFTMAGGAYSAPAAMTVAGDFARTGGTFTHNNGTVTFDGTNQTISGALTFYNLTKNVSAAATLTFPASTTTTITNTTDLRGASGQRLSIRSSSSGTVATLDSQGTKTIQYLDVKDNTAVTNMVCLTSCLNSGNNTKWYFSTSISVTESAGATNITEGGAGDSYTLVLTAPPSSSVTVNIAGGTPQAASSTGAVVFTVDNWETPQTITISATNDNIAEGSHTATFTHTSASSDTNYNAISISNLVANITDNDSAGFTIGSISRNTGESGTGATFTVVLTSEPTANVTLPYSSSDTSEGTLSGTGLTFTSLNWSSAQTVNVTGVEDYLDDGDIAYSIVLSAASSGDANYNNVNPSDVSVTNTDDDTSAVTISESALTLSESGTVDTYTVVLGAQPASSVTVLLTGNSQIVLSSSGATSTGVIFSTVNWNTPQTVTVTASDDAVVEGTHSGTIVHEVDSSDLIYDALTLSSVTYSISDNDVAAVSDTPVFGGGGGGGGGGSSNEEEDDNSSGGSGGSDDDDSGESEDDGSHPFVDTIGHWSEPAVLSLFERDIVKGKAPGLYAPNDNITRAEFLKIVILNAGYQISDFSGASFRDVSERDWYYDYVSFAEFSGFIKGYGDGTFRPNAPINRAEAVSILMIIAKQGITTFSEKDLKFHDIETSDWYTSAVVNASKKGIVQGYTDGSFRPASNMTRAEMAVVAKRAFDVYFQ